MSRIFDAGGGACLVVTRYKVAPGAGRGPQRRLRRIPDSSARWKPDRLKSLGIIVLLALAVFAYGLYSDVTLTRCVRGTVSAALGLCASGE